MKKQVYLDYAAATPLDPMIKKAIEPYFSDKFYNPSASYSAAVQTKRELKEATASIGKNLGVKPNEIVMTSGGSEANNLAISGVMQQNLEKTILVSAVEHDSVMEPAISFNNKLIPVDKHGRIILERLKELLNDDVAMISVMQVNNEVGSIQPIREIAKIIDEARQDRKSRAIKTPLFLHSDACQSPQYLDVHPNRLGVDLMTLNGGKIYGPKQSGILFVKTGVKLTPQIKGGGQQRGLRSGTESPAQTIGFAKALDKAISLKDSETNRMLLLQKKFFEGLGNLNSGIIVNGHNKKRLPNNIHVTIPGVDNERLIYQLDEAGIMVAAGSACSAEDGEPSHVLNAMGVSDKDARSSLRMTMGRPTTGEEITYVLKTLKQLLA